MVNMLLNLLIIQLKFNLALTLTVEQIQTCSVAFVPSPKLLDALGSVQMSLGLSATVDILTTIWILALYEQNCSSIQFQEASLKLEQQPSSVEEFVQYLIYLGKLSSDLPVMETEYNLITKLYAVANDFNVFVPPEDLALYQILPPNFQHLKVKFIFLE